MFADLDIEAWADMVQEMGAAYVIFTITWGEVFVAAPIQSVEKITPGRTTIQHGGEDYLMQIADALNKRGIELIFYFHHGQGDARRIGEEEGTWWKDFNTKLLSGLETEPDDEGREIFNANYRAVIAEIGERYGEKLYGWWFDDGWLLYPQNYAEISWNARKGNDKRIIAYNSSRSAPYTRFQDYIPGEDRKRFSGLEPKGRFPQVGDFPGYQAHGLLRAERDWAVYPKDPKITIRGEPEADGFAKLALEAAQKQYCLTFNVMMYNDGTVHPQTLERLRRAKAALEEVGYQREFEALER